MIFRKAFTLKADFKGDRRKKPPKQKVRDRETEEGEKHIQLNGNAKCILHLQRFQPTDKQSNVLNYQIKPNKSVNCLVSECVFIYVFIECVERWCDAVPCGVL